MIKEEKEKQRDFKDFIVKISRVTKVTKGGKRFRFSVFVVSGDQQGRVGIGLGKGKDISSAMAKAIKRARKDLITVPLRENTVPYNVQGRHGASKVVIRSACKGTGVIAGGPMRAIFEGLGVQDVLTKSYGSTNKQNVVKATLNALAKMRSVQEIARLRGKTIEQVVKGSHVAAA